MRALSAIVLLSFSLSVLAQPDYVCLILKPGNPAQFRIPDSQFAMKDGQVLALPTNKKVRGGCALRFGFTPEDIATGRRLLPSKFLTVVKVNPEVEYRVSAQYSGSKSYLDLDCNLKTLTLKGIQDSLGTLLLVEPVPCPQGLVYGVWK